MTRTPDLTSLDARNRPSPQCNSSVALAVPSSSQASYCGSAVVGCLSLSSVALWQCPHLHKLLVFHHVPQVSCQ